LAGSGVYWDDASASLASFADVAGVPVFMNGAGRGSLSPAHPCAFAHARGFALGSADLVLALGAPLDFRLGYGRPPTFAEDARVGMVDCDPVELGRNRPLELGLIGHVGRILDQLVEILPAGLAGRFEEWRRRVGQKERDSRGALETESLSDAVPIS